VGILISLSQQPLVPPQPIILVKIRIGRHDDGWHWMRLQLIQHQLHTRFKLSVMPGREILWRILDRHIGRNAAILNLKIAIQAIDGKPRSGHIPAIEQCRVA
jgi:hypothetical protein